MNKMKRTTMAAIHIPGILLAVALLLLTQGCMVGPDFTDPVAEVPQSYRSDIMPTTDIGELEWWEQFDDPVLYELVTTALENNRDLKIAASRILQARATLGFTRADQFPRIDVEAGANTGTFSGRSFSDETVTNLYATAPLTWEIDFWGKFRRASESARAELIASEFGMKSVQLTLVADVVANYQLLLDFHRRLKVSEETFKSRLDTLEIIQQRFNRGIIGELDLNQAQIQKEIAAASIPFYKRSIAKTENSLSILVGRMPAAITTGENLYLESDPPDIPVGTPSDILQRRPDVAEAKFLLQAQNAQVGVAQALRFPSFTLTGALGYASTELASVVNEGGVWSVGGTILGPLIDFGKNKQRVEIERQKTEQALYRYENTLLQAFREVEDALVEIATYREELAAINRQQQAAKKARMLSGERYDKGVSSYLEVLETERSLFNVELRRSELQQLYLNAYVNIYKALGGGWTGPDPTLADNEASGEEPDRSYR